MKETRYHGKGLIFHLFVCGNRSQEASKVQAAVKYHSGCAKE